MKFSRWYAVPVVAVSALMLTPVALAQEAVTVKDVNVRAGPDRGYPLVAWVSGGTSVYVNGCLDDFRWCDVTAGANRGWVYARNLQYIYQGQPMTIYGNGQTLALPIISFILGSYWNDNYRNRPWYGNQNQWSNFRPGYRPPRPPIIRPQPPRPPIQIQPPRPRPPVVRPQPQPPRPQVQPPRPQMPPGVVGPQPPRAQPMPKPSEGGRGNPRPAPGGAPPDRGGAEG